MFEMVSSVREMAAKKSCSRQKRIIIAFAFVFYLVFIPKCVHVCLFVLFKY